MNTRYRTALLVLLFGIAVSAFVTPASAASPPNALLIAPGEPYGLPKFGFSSSTIYGFGERVVFVRPGGRAYHLGLEPGDVILSLNGYNLTYSGSWNDALSRALSYGNVVRLRVRDIRTGNVFVKETYVGFSDGPINHYYTTGAPQPHVIHHNNNGPHTVTIKEIAKLFD